MCNTNGIAALVSAVLAISICGLGLVIFTIVDLVQQRRAGRGFSWGRFARAVSGPLAGAATGFGALGLVRGDRFMTGLTADKLEALWLALPAVVWIGVWLVLRRRGG